MANIPLHQIRKLGSYSLTRDGMTIPGAEAMREAACWNFALTGTELSMRHPNSPLEIFEGDAGLLNINNYAGDQPVVIGLKPTATLAHFPGCQTELNQLTDNIGAAIMGGQFAQQQCQEALVKIVVRRNGLLPGAEGDRYQLHMKATSWFGWDHWGISVKPEQPGRPRIFIQTVTGQPLQHACSTMWDEHLGGVTINLQELHQTQVTFINMVNTFGKLCVQCGAAHGFIPSNPLNAWHRCTVCRAVYCPTHGQALGGKAGWNDRTRKCSQFGCNGRTEVVSII